MADDKKVIQSIEKLVSSKIQKIDEVGKISSYKVGVSYKGKKAVALSLDKLELTSIPDLIQKLDELEYLSLANNAIGTVPGWIGKMKSLKSLILTGNKIELLPSSLGKSKSLETLHVLNNPIEELPISFRRFADIYSQFRELAIKRYGLERRTRETVDMMKNRGVRLIEPKR